MPKNLLLSLENLKELDFGKADEAFQGELAHVVKDCQDRPLDKTARKVTLTFLLKPEAHTDSMSHQPDCERILVGLEITGSVPKRRTRVYDMLPRQDGTLVFHSESPSDADANLLYDQVTGEIQT